MRSSIGCDYSGFAPSLLDWILGYRSSPLVVHRNKAHGHKTSEAIAPIPTGENVFSVFSTKVVAQVHTYARSSALDHPRRSTGLFKFAKCTKITYRTDCGKEPQIIRGGSKMIGTHALNFVLRTPRGQNLLEYALVGAFLAVAIDAIMSAVSGSISILFSQISSATTAALLSA